MSVDTTTFRPTVDQVGALLRARTQDENMQELGTFTDATRPTNDQVENLIDMAMTSFSAEVRVDPCSDTLNAAAAGHLALTVAMMVELSYFPEQVASARSPYDQLRQLWESQHLALVDSIRWT